VVRRSLTLIAVATVAVVAIGLSAATLLSTVSPASPGSGLGGNGSDPSLFEEREPGDPPEGGDGTELPRALEILLTVLLVGLFVGSLIYMVFYRPQLLLTIALVALGGLVLWVILQYVVWDGVDLFGGGGGLFGGESGGAGNDENADGTVPVLPVVLSVLLGMGRTASRSSVS
jgi:preprotein translocase subunit SecG